MATVLIELPGGEGIVRREDGEIALTHDVTLDRGQSLQPHDRYEPLRVGLSGERMLFGDCLRLVRSAWRRSRRRGVRKTAVVGGGTYAVIFEDGEHGDPALGYRDAAGAFVPRPMPAEYPHQPVTDAEEPCPVCGVVQYEEYFPEPPDGAGEDAAARDARMARIRAEQAVQRWYSNQMTLSAVTVPTYAAEGWPARINGQASRGDDVVGLTIAHAETLSDAVFLQRPRIEVTTSIDPHQPGELTVARDAFAAGIEADATTRLLAPRPAEP